MKTKLSILIETLDGTVTLPIERITQINTPKEMVVFEKMDSGGWRLTYSAKTIPEIETMKSLRLVRVIW